MPDQDYSHRDIIDKLGIKASSVVRFDEQGSSLDEALRAKVLERTGGTHAEQGETADVVLVPLHAGVDAAEVLRRWRTRIRPDGAIWLLTPKRGRPGYVDQRELIQITGTAHQGGSLHAHTHVPNNPRRNHLLLQTY